MPSAVSVVGSVRGLMNAGGLSICNDVGGAPACCGGCPYYYLATLCNPTCSPVPRYVYICGTGKCYPNTPQQAPLVHNQIIKIGPRCYSVNTQTRYCPPGAVPTASGINDPAEQPCVPMPVRAPISEAWECVANCGSPLCAPITGYFKLKACSNTPPFGVEAYVCCELYEEALGSFACPVFGRGFCAAVCWYVEPNTEPIGPEELPPGAQIICAQTPSLTISGSCCGCCQVSEPGCCLCTDDRLILRMGSNCEPLYEQTPSECSLWSESGSAVQGGGWTLVSQMNFGNVCPVSFNCWRMVSATTLRLTAYTFTGDCQPGPSVQCAAGACSRSISVAQTGPPSTFDFEIGRCDPLQTLFAPGQLYGVPSLGSCGPGQCNWSGIRYADCRNMTGSLVNDLTTCGGQKYEECFGFQRTAIAGTCGDDACGQGGQSRSFRMPGLVLPDGSPADSIGSIRTGGCAGCGGEKGERL